MLDTLEAQLPVFIRMAEDVRLDVTLMPGTKYAFEDVKTNGAWMIFNMAYSLGAQHATKETFERME